MSAENVEPKEDVLIVSTSAVTSCSSAADRPSRPVPPVAPSATAQPGEYGDRVTVVVALRLAAKSRVSPEMKRLYPVSAVVWSARNASESGPAPATAFRFTELPLAVTL